MFATNTLLKKFWRSDRIWTHSIFDRKTFKKIPLFWDIHALMASQYWDRERIEDIQERRLRALFEHAQRIPFWKDALLPITLNEPIRLQMSKLPITSKKVFSGKKHGEYTDSALLSTSQLERTSGTTGKPFEFYHDRGYQLRSYAICERIFRTVSGGVRYPVISIRARERAGFALINYHFFHVRGFNSIRHRFLQLVELISSFDGNVVLFGFSSWILELARLIREQGLTLRLKAVMAAGEELSDGRRHEIEKTLGTKLYMYYATSELGRLAFECEHRRLHLNEEWAYVETVDDAGSPVMPGNEGRIVVTVFDTMVMPFIRYDSGDRGVMSEDACPCGRTLRTIRLKGRQITLITFDDGRTVSLLDIPPIFDLHASAIRQFQIVRTAEYAFTVRVIPTPRFAMRKEVVAEHLVRALHPRANISWEVTDALTEGRNGKALYFIDQRTSASPYV